jgi:putative methylase
MRKRELEIALEGLERVPSPDRGSEQYFTPSSLAAEIVFNAHLLGDVDGKVMADFGCGNGILGIAALMLGASFCHFLDISPAAAEVTLRNLRRLGLPGRVLRCDVEEFNERVDTVIQNPPFGAQRRHADLPFLKKALEVADVVYTIHNAVTEEFIKRKVMEFGAEVTHLWRRKFPIPRMYSHHRKERVLVEVVVLRAERSG